MTDQPASNENMLAHQDVPSINRIFNHAVLAHAIAAGDQLGIFDEIHRTGSISSSRIASDAAINVLGLTALLEVLEQGALIERHGSVYRAGAQFREFFNYKGFFTWLFAASGRVLSGSANFILANWPEVSSAYGRDADLIASACADFGKYEIDPTIAGLDVWGSVQHVVDLGCGSACRLVALAEQYPINGTGIDISPDAIASAVENVASAGFEDRVELKCMDVTDFPLDFSLPTADAIVTCLMGHDLWPRHKATAVLGRFLDVFPNSKFLILCDTVRSEMKSLNERIPSLGYEYIHGLMGQYIPGREEWHEVLRESGWRVNNEHFIQIPSNTVVFVARRIDDLRR